MSLLLLVLACTGAEEGGAGDTGVDLGDGPHELELPDLTGVDLPGAFAEALGASTAVTLSAAWQGHDAAMAGHQGGCPDIYVGEIEAADMVDTEDALTWQDWCNPGGSALAFGGWLTWDGSVVAEGDPESEDGRTIDATRRLAGDAIVLDGADTLFSFEGEGSESLYVDESPGYRRWTWSSLVEGTVAGSAATGTEKGWRTDLYMAAAGGDAPSLELRGNVYFFEPVIADRFDSVAADLSFGTDLSCELEPRGWIGLRDSDAYWYDLVFLPLDDGGDGETGGNPGYDECDGCGTLYVRGIETVEYGTVCPDWGGSWSLEEGAVPDPGDFLLTLREVLAMEEE